MVFLYSPRQGGIQRFKFKPRTQTFNKLLQDFGGAEVGEAEAKYVPRTESAEASPESSQIHHSVNAEEAAAWRAPRAASAEEAPQDSPVEETWVDNLPANHLLTQLPKSRSWDACLQAKLYESPHRRRENQREARREAREKEDPEQHLERIAIDFIIASDLVGQARDKVCAGHS